MDELLSVRVDVDLVLDVVDILVGTNPGGPCSQMWEVFLVDIILLISGSHEIERLGRSHSGDGLVRSFVKVIVNNFAKIDNAALLDLNFSTLVQLDS